MRLIITGGGTGGHLFPGIAVATAIQQQDAANRILFIGTSRLLDQQTLAGLGFELAALDCGGVKGLHLVEKIRSMLQMPGAVLQALGIMRRFRPHLVFGVGGYVTGPVLLAAKILRVPIAIHEQNSVPGMANRLAGKLADRIFISLPCSPAFSAAKTLQTGNPVRQEILAVAGQVKPKTAKRTILVLGGSQGAHRVNTLMVEAIKKMVEHRASLRVIHQTGAADREMVAAQYDRLNVEAEVVAFIRDMASVYACADFVVTRAGATTLAEIAVMGLPALLIPYPYAADNHQVTNGRYYVKGKGALMVEEAELSGEILARTLSEYLHNPEELHTMAANMKALAMPDATNKIVEECLRLASRT